MFCFVLSRFKADFHSRFMVTLRASHVERDTNDFFIRNIPIKHFVHDYFLFLLGSYVAIIVFNPCIQSQYVKPPTR